jgi:glycyl-tRNA synthetase alpha subunit
MKNICPLAPYTIKAEISNLEDALAVVTLNSIWQSQGCKITQPDEIKMLGDYC